MCARGYKIPVAQKGFVILFSVAPPPSDQKTNDLFCRTVQSRFPFAPHFHCHQQQTSMFVVYKSYQGLFLSDPVGSHESSPNEKQLISTWSMWLNKFIYPFRIQYTSKLSYAFSNLIIAPTWADCANIQIRGDMTREKWISIRGLPSIIGDGKYRWLR